MKDIDYLKHHLHDSFKSKCVGGYRSSCGDVDSDSFWISFGVVKDLELACRILQTEDQALIPRSIVTHVWHKRFH